MKVTARGWATAMGGVLPRSIKSAGRSYDTRCHLRAELAAPSAGGGAHFVRPTLLLLSKLIVGKGASVGWGGSPTRNHGGLAKPG